MHRLELSRTSVPDELAVDHDGDSIAELLRFVHPMRRQKQRCLVKLLQHFEEAAAGQWVDARRRLVQELHLWTSKQRHGAYELPFVAAAEVLSDGV